MSIYEKLRAGLPESVDVSTVTELVGVVINGRTVDRFIAETLWSYLWRHKESFGEGSVVVALDAWLRNNETTKCETCGALPILLSCGDCMTQAWRLPCGHGREQVDGSGYYSSCSACLDAEQAAESAAEELREVLPQFRLTALRRFHDVLVFDDEREFVCTTSRARELAKMIRSGEYTAENLRSDSLCR